MRDGLYYKGLLALLLNNKISIHDKAYVVFSDVFEVDNRQLQEFDNTFECKEKLVLPCQEIYRIACAELDE